MLYQLSEQDAFVVIQYIIVELDGINFIPSSTFKEQYFDEEKEAYTAISYKGKPSTRYLVLPTSIIFRPDPINKR